MDVNYEQILSIIKQKKEINKPDFNDLNVYRDGKLIEFTDKMKETAKFTGLNNTLLIEIFVNELDGEE